MPEEKKEETAEDKIAQSTGNETELMSKELEDEADQIIKDMYHSDEGDKGDNTDEGDNKEGEDKDTGDTDKDDDEDPKDTDEDAEVDDKGNDSVDELLKKLQTSEKRVKDTRSEFTKKTQELSDYKKKTEDLEDTVFGLKTKIDELANAQQTKAEEKKTEREIVKETKVLTEQMEAIKKVDPDLALAMEPVLNGLVSQIDSLKSEIKTNEKNQVEKERMAQAKSEQDAADAHFEKLDKAHEGWEDTMKTPEFEKYLKELSPREKRLALMDLKDGTAENIIEVFDGFKDSTKKDDDTDPEDKIKKAKGMTNPDLKKSKEINRGARKMLFTRSQIAAMEPDEYAKHETAIDNAMAAGQIDLAN